MQEKKQTGEQNQVLAGRNPVLEALRSGRELECIYIQSGSPKVIRTADAAGAPGVIIPKRHSAGLTAAAVKSSAGAAVCLPVVRVANIVATMQSLKAEKNVWFTCADMDGVNWCQLDFKGAVGLVIGSEGNGVSRLVKEECDFVAALPMQGQINSLNASVAGGIILYEITRQRLGLKAR